jgi:RNA polymerase sigma-70 factor, ECF subfamily
MCSDAQLVERVRRGDLQAYAGLVARYEYAVRGSALGILRNYHAAEDTAQDAFVAAYQKLGGLRNGARFGPWLMRIVKRLALTRARAKPPPAAFGALAEPADPHRDGRLDDELERLLQLVQRLPEQERVVVVLHHFDARGVQQVADITGRPVGTVTKQLSRAYARLRHWLSKKETHYERQ